MKFHSAQRGPFYGLLRVEIKNEDTMLNRHINFKRSKYVDVNAKIINDEQL